MPRSVRPVQSQAPSWQEELANSFQNVEQLFEYLGLDPRGLPPTQSASNPFPFKVTRSFAEKIERGNINDPLLKQILPSMAELTNPPDFVDNPVGDLEAIATPGLLHKYYSRVLLITTGTCAVNCRYCFRRNYPYSGNQLGISGRAEALRYIESRVKIKEVILSGGDPLVLANPGLEQLIGAIAAIQHVERLRIHTRIPSVLPARIDPDLVRILETTRLKTVVVTHINHPREIDAKVRIAVASLLDAGVRVLNQAVLLKGINDDPEILSELLETAFDAGIHPYYLHMLDRATGTAHFEVAQDYSLYLEKTLRNNLPGYLLPRFVREVVGLPYKVPIQGSVGLQSQT
ncbi:MAG: EF-P beta-lysylation protein EpmB [Methylococcaceae bacterium]|nr:EF-P beta-lysylation protein EpmB [Methylococcaceae bacterium]